MNYSTEFDDATLALLRIEAAKHSTPFENMLEAAQNIAKHLPDEPGKSESLIRIIQGITGHGCVVQKAFVYPAALGAEPTNATEYEPLTESVTARPLYKFTLSEARGPIPTPAQIQRVHAYVEKQFADRGLVVTSGQEP